MTSFEAGLDGVTFLSHGFKLLGGFYKAAGNAPRPTAILIHGLPGVEKHLDIAYSLRDLGWNCLYFHFRGSWGSAGTFSLNGLADDTRAAVEWVRRQPSVDQERIALIGGSTGFYPAVVCAANDPRICAIVGISPLIEPRSFQFPAGMSREFATLLNGVGGNDLEQQWQDLEPLADKLEAIAPRPVLLVAAGQDSLFPVSEYAGWIRRLSASQLIVNEESDHGFSSCRAWLVRTVTDWLVSLNERRGSPAPGRSA